MYGWILVLVGFWAVDQGRAYLAIGLYTIGVGVGVVVIARWIRRELRRAVRDSQP